MADQIRLRRDSAADWTTANPVLLDGEAGVESDTHRVKFGDGSTAWSALPYTDAAGPAVVAAAPWHPGFITGRYYGHPAYTASSTGFITPVLNQLYVAPLIVPNAVTIDTLAVSLSTTGAGSARLGIYADNGGTPAGGALIVDGGSASFAADPATKTISQALTKNLYWLAMLCTTAGGNARAWTVNTFLFGYTGVTGTGPTGWSHYQAAGVAGGVLPSTCPAVTGQTSNPPRLMARAA